MKIVAYTVDSSFHTGFPLGSTTTPVLNFLFPDPNITEYLWRSAKTKST